MSKGEGLEQAEDLSGKETALAQEDCGGVEKEPMNTMGLSVGSSACISVAESEDSPKCGSAPEPVKKARQKFPLKAWLVYLLKWIGIYLGIAIAFFVVGALIVESINDQVLEGNFTHAAVVALGVDIFAFIPFVLALVTIRILRKRKDSSERKGKTAAGILILLGLHVLLIFSMLIFPAHNWKNATCVTPKACAVCGFTEGEALGHEWVDASCTEPKKCSRCGKTEGAALGHDMRQPTCTEGSVCNRCGQEFPTTGHKWKDATCTAPKTCTACGIIEGEALGHTTTNGTCSRCGQKIFETVRGTGDDVVENVQLSTGMYRVHVINSGRGNFVLRTDGNANNRDLKINEIGSYDGYIFLMGGDTYKFEIESSGSWSYEIEEVSTTSETRFSGRGDYATDKISCSSGTWHFTHDGNSNFVVKAYTTGGADLSVNTIGSYDGKKSIDVPSGSNLLFEIHADGNWVIEKQ